MFQFRVRPENLDEYTRRHAAVWPDMLLALHETGWENYSLFTRPDGLVVGYFETADLDAAQAGMALREVNARWQAEMAEFFADAGPDEEMDQLTEVFHLETQLAAAETAATDHTAHSAAQD
jgi:L-rhamnose mutarotase